MAMLADPVLLTLILFLVGLGVITVSKRAGVFIGLLAAVYLYLAATPLASSYALATLEIDLQKYANRANAQPDAIVILGADIFHRAPEIGSDSVGRLSLERIRFGAHLYRQTGLPILVTGAEIGDSTKSVAAAMAEALLADQQVAVRWLEESARNTFENAELTATILRACTCTPGLCSRSFAIGVWVTGFGARPAVLDGCKLVGANESGQLLGVSGVIEPEAAGANDKPTKPYNAQLRVHTTKVKAAQQAAIPILDANAKRWQEAQVIQKEDGTSMVVFDVRLKKSADLSALVREIEKSETKHVDKVELEKRKAIKV